MPYLILGLVLIAAVYAPQFWAQRVLKKYSLERDSFPGTGGELAEHFIERFELNGVQVTMTDQGDHYNPKTHTVGLSKENYSGKSLTAITVAAHEIGHAIQHLSLIHIPSPRDS